MPAFVGPAGLAGRALGTATERRCLCEAPRRRASAAGGRRRRERTPWTATVAAPRADEAAEVIGDGGQGARTEQGGGGSDGRGLLERWSLAEPVVSLEGMGDYLEAMRLSADRPVVLKVWARWCRSCRALEPKVKRLAREFPHMLFVQLEYEANKELCWRLAVRNMPLFLFYHGSAGERDRFTCGPARAALLRQKVEHFAKAAPDYDPTAQLQEQENPAPALGGP